MSVPLQLSVSIEAMFGLNWNLWRKLIRQVELAGFYGLYRSDHFMIGKTGADSLELITSLVYASQHSQAIRFGSLVAPLSVHNPVVLARQAMALNDLSGGRMILGVGSGWHAEEHSMFGFELGDKKTRLNRLGEGLHVMRELIHNPTPVTFDGQFYQLREAQLLPQSPVKILVGGNGATRTLPLAARYADIWNGQVVDPAAYGALNTRLDELISAAGRPPRAVKRTVIVPVLCVRTPEDLQRHIAMIQQYAPPFYQSSAEEVEAWLRGLKGIIGSPQQVVDGLAAYAENQAEEIMLEWFSLYDMEGIDVLARDVLPHFR